MICNYKERLKALSGDESKAVYQKHSALEAMHHLGFETDNKTWFVNQKSAFAQSEENVGEEIVTNMITAKLRLG